MIILNLLWRTIKIMIGRLCIKAIKLVTKGERYDER